MRKAVVGALHPDECKHSAAPWLQLILGCGLGAVDCGVNATQLAYYVYDIAYMNTAVLDSDILSSKKREKASTRHEKKAKQEAVFNREAFDKALDESLNDLMEGRVYEVDMKNPKESLRKIMDHARRAK
jgi:hypothetical protein